MDKKKLLKLLEALEADGMRLVVKEFNENILFPEFKSYRIGTTLIELVSTKDKKKYKKKCKQLAREAIESNEEDYDNNIKFLEKLYVKEKKQEDNFTDKFYNSRVRRKGKKKRG